MLREMAERNESAAAIGAALNRTPDAIRSRAAAWGISIHERRRHRPAPDGRVHLPHDLWLRLKVAAQGRNISPGKLARQLLEPIVNGRNFFAAAAAPPAPARPEFKSVGAAALPGGYEAMVSLQAAFAPQLIGKLDAAHTI